MIALVLAGLGLGLLTGVGLRAADRGRATRGSAGRRGAWRLAAVGAVLGLLGALAVDLVAPGAQLPATIGAAGLVVAGLALFVVVPQDTGSIRRADPGAVRYLPWLATLPALVAVSAGVAGFGWSTPAVLAAYLVGALGASTLLPAAGPRGRAAMSTAFLLAAVVLYLNPPGVVEPVAAPPPRPGVRLELSNLDNGENTLLSRCEGNPAAELRDCGPAPEFRKIESWLHTRNGAPLRLSELRGSVVLVDFWAYSCINCRRTVPYLNELRQRYQDAGLRIVGVHSPEHPFEGRRDNVAAESDALGIEYPVGLDNEGATFNDYRNRYWPAQYLIDARGTVRYLQLGEGGHRAMERNVRTLLADAAPGVRLPAPSNRGENPPTRGRTPQLSLSFAALSKAFVTPGPQPLLAAQRRYRFPTALPRNTFGLDGTWSIDYQAAIAGRDARLRVNYYARSAGLVLAGQGTVTVSVDGGPARTVPITGTPTLRELIRDPAPTGGVLTVTLSPGLRVYMLSFD